MIAPLLALALGTADAGWIEVKANGFSFQMPTQPELKSGPITWPTTGQMTLTEWSSKLSTGDQQLDLLDCYEGGVPLPRMSVVLHEKFCTPEAGEQLRWDRTDPATQARECLLASPKRRKLVKVLQVGANLCVLSSSARTEKAASEPSPQMRRFVDSLQATGKPTIVSLTNWVVIKGDRFQFEAPEKIEPKLDQGADPKLGKFKSTKWRLRLGVEELNLLCLAGPTVTSPAALEHLKVVCEMPGAKIVQTKLPNGASQCANPGPPAVLVRFFPMRSQVCMIGATRDLGELSTAARRFVKSFTRVK